MTGRTITYLGVALTMAVFTVLWSTGTSLAGEARLDTAAIERLTGAKGELSEKEGVFKVSVPRERPRHHRGRREDDAAAWG